MYVQTMLVSHLIVLSVLSLLLSACCVHLKTFILLVCVVAQFGHQGAVLKN